MLPEKKYLSAQLNLRCTLPAFADNAAGRVSARVNSPRVPHLPKLARLFLFYDDHLVDGTISHAADLSEG
jgi:hypothetical protein